MDKRNFIKSTTALALGSVLPISCSEQKKATEPIKNWSGNLQYSTSNFIQPKTVDELSSILKKNKKLKLLGSQHCFNAIADSDQLLVSTGQLDKIISLDTQANTVTVEPGIKYGRLAEYLQPKGYAIQNLASLPHISVGGAIATATHGSGLKNGNLASQVLGLELVLADGTVKTMDKNTSDDLVNACIVHLGALGAVTKLTLAIEPSFEVRQDIWENLPFAELEKNLIPIMSSGYSVSLFTDWMNNNVSEVWIKSKISSTSEFKSFDTFYGAKAAIKNIHPIIELDAINCTDQMGVPGPWHERLPHFKMNFTPSSGKELQSEFFVPIENGYAALKSINDNGAKWKNHLFISEVRTVLADNMWMSTAFGRDTLVIHFTWKQHDEVYALIPEVEALLKPFQARPHWGKLFNYKADYLQTVYPRYADFKKLINEYDPTKKFRNGFLESVFG